MENLQRTPFTFIFAVTVYLFYVIAFYYPSSSYVEFTNVCKNESCHQALHAPVERTPMLWEDEVNPNYVVNNPDCKIMAMDPFDTSVRKYIGKAKPQKCAQRIAKMDKQKLKIDEKTIKTWKKNKVTKTNCCYRAIDRVQQKPDKYNKDADWGIKYRKTCHHIPTDNGNQGIIVNDTFIKVECQLYGKANQTKVEFQGIVLPPQVNSKTTRIKAEYWDNRKQQGFSDPPSILIIGIDSISRLHMIRSLPKTREYLKQNDFIEMKGYTKIGENTFPNIMAGFGGMELDNYTSCWPNSSAKLDDCPFMWKQYSDVNYITAFLEDSPGIAIFNRIKTGFVLPPADYYLRPLTVAMNKYHKRGHGGGQAFCVGGLSATKYQLNYIQDFVQNMGKNYPYFLFSWFTSLGHDDFNGLKAVDSNFYDLFSVSLNKTSANPDNTIIIFMSDHGYRFGSFRETFLGYYEDNLPFIYFRLPVSLKVRYPEWYSNLQRNTRQLTSPLDLHSTLTQTLHNARHMIQNTSINSSINFDSNQDSPFVKTDIHGEPTNPQNKARYSFFEYIPVSRNCESSSIPQRYCMCGVTTDASRFSTNSSQFGDIVISHVNDLLQSVINSGQCHKLEFKKFLYVREVGHGTVWNNFQKFNNYKDFLVAVEAKPSKAHFESKVRLLENTTLHILGEITRVNSYGKQSDCLSNFELKPYCFCKKR